MKKTIVTCAVLVLSGMISILNAQTDYTDYITNPSFETGDNSGWAWTGTNGYAWIGPNTDGDATKDGTYINGLWNSSIGDAECSQTISGLPSGYYIVTAMVTVSSGRLTNQRLFAESSSTTKSMLYGKDTHTAYNETNLGILDASESYSFGDYDESAAENGPFQKLSVVSQVSDGSITIGIRVSGKSSALSYDFSHTTSADAGFFKFDNFTIAEASDVVTLDDISLSQGFLDWSFEPAILSYTATLPQGVSSVTPTVIPSVEGVTITGTEEVDLTSGSGVSTIIVTALDGVTQLTYTIEYEVTAPLEGDQQDRLYPNEFPLGDIKLLDGPFKNACDLNIQTLLEYDVDRLLAPYRKEAGLASKAESYSNWIGLDGHIGGHYLTAMAINYAGTGDTTCKRLMDYMVSELKTCQEANAHKYPDWAIGYAGGVPSSNFVWPNFKNGNFTNYNSAWVPWYNLHKTYAGLRDAWLYGNNDTAKAVFLSFCDWAIEITSDLSSLQMATMLDVEHGGMNEIFADAYQMSGAPKYFTAAKRFSHKEILNSMAVHIDNLDNKHANTQIPKAVGFQRIAEISKEKIYVDASEFFWETVTGNRSLALGGNSRREHFPEASASNEYIHEVQGPESCNTYNMLKLTEHLFRVSPQARYADFYERALYNHILSTQHPEHGGYVYFTPVRPQHYRVYSAPEEAMWCCVGTGMENHGKYGEFIYTHSNESVYLNLFIASELNWKKKGVIIRQETSFPEEMSTKLVINSDAPVDFKLLVRSPSWVAEGMLKIIVNTDTLSAQFFQQTYIPIERTWNDGDSVRILLPMHTTIEQMPNVPNYIALLHGPVLMGAKTGAEDLAGLIADDSRMGHVASGSRMDLSKAPVIVSERDSIVSKIIPVEGEELNFSASTLFADTMDNSLVLEPFYKIHDSRYMMYWMALTEDDYEEFIDSLAAEQMAELELEARTIDQVATGEQQSEVEHDFQSMNSYSGSWEGEFWRDARDGGFISYTFQTMGKTGLSLMVRYWGNEVGSRSFDILIDEERLLTENIIGKWNVNEFVDVEYQIPDSMASDKSSINVKFQAINSSNVAGGLFYVRLLQALESTELYIPDIPEGLIAIAGIKSVTLSWESAAYAKSYIVMRATSVNGPYEILDSVSTVSYVDSTISLDVTYFYKVEGLNSKGAGEASEPVSIIVVDIPVDRYEGMCNIYPNPFNNFLRLSFENLSEEGVCIEIINSNGCIVFSKQILEKDITLNLESLNSGLYYIKTMSRDTMSVKKIIKI